jgi:hypothetical protein
VAIEPTGTTWYADGAKVCHTTATSDGQTNIISNLAVYATIPPAATTTSATKHVDYIRAWIPGWDCARSGVFGPTRRAEVRRDGHCE